MNLQMSDLEMRERGGWYGTLAEVKALMGVPKEKYPLYFDDMDAIAKLNFRSEYMHVHEKILTISTTPDFKQYTIGHELGHRNHFIPIHVNVEDEKYAWLKKKLETDANFQYYTALSQKLGADMAMEKITSGVTEMSRVLYVLFRDQS
ncbi:MAG: hypothetical protein NT016_00955, partial [Candidatus Aenigmarchaeota archaeon]|nr:hypothetical protein [Candidatus Aenigmarchaeota archaeon]